MYVSKRSSEYPLALHTYTKWQEARFTHLNNVSLTHITIRTRTRTRICSSHSNHSESFYLSKFSRITLKQATLSHIGVFGMRIHILCPSDVQSIRWHSSVSHISHSRWVQLFEIHSVNLKPNPPVFWFEFQKRSNSRVYFEFPSHCTFCISFYTFNVHSYWIGPSKAYTRSLPLTFHKCFVHVSCFMFLCVMCVDSVSMSIRACYCYREFYKHNFLYYGFDGIRDDVSLSHRWAAFCFEPMLDSVDEGFMLSNLNISQPTQNFSKTLTW